jgi:plasmid stabilization system protein ParE
MIRDLVLRRRALVEVQEARSYYDHVEHGRRFLEDFERVLEAIRAMPLRFPAIVGPIRRALLRRYPYAIFFRVRPSGPVVILAVIHQRRDPAIWPRP